MRQLKDRMTNEQILKRFDDDSFRLVNYAIELGKEAIQQGRDFHTRPDILNQAYQILLEIDLGKDQLPPPERKSAPVEEHFAPIPQGQ